MNYSCAKSEQCSPGIKGLKALCEMWAGGLLVGFGLRTRRGFYGESSLLGIEVSVEVPQMLKVAFFGRFWIPIHIF